MELPAFVELKRPKWASLESLLDRAERGGLKTLTLDEAKSLSRLYRGASSDLLWVRAQGANADVSEFLNDLVGRAYALTYPGKRARWSDVRQFLLNVFPDTMWREWRMFAASMLLFFGGAGFGWVGMLVDPQAAPYLVPGDHLKLDPIERAKKEANSEGHGADEQAAFVSFLFTHNISVAILAFALGLTVGVGTVILMFTNGVMLGALAWVYASKGMAGWFWAWILPHGIPEITAIGIAGAAGLILARGIVAPKGLARRAALRVEAKTAMVLLIGTLALFVLAGCIEGTISQIHPPALSVEFKVGFALVVGAAVYAYLFSAVLRQRAAPTTAPMM